MIYYEESVAKVDCSNVHLRIQPTQDPFHSIRGDQNQPRFTPNQEPSIARSNRCKQHTFRNAGMLPVPLYAIFGGEDGAQIPHRNKHSISKLDSAKICSAPVMAACPGYSIGRGENDSWFVEIAPTHCHE